MKNMTGKKISAFELKKIVDEYSMGVTISEELCDDPLIKKTVEIMARFEEFQKERDRVFGECDVIASPLKNDINNVINWYEKLLQDSDQLLDKVEKDMNLWCSCHQGCEACCHNNMITIGYPEAYIIKYFIQSSSFTRKQREKVYKRISEQTKIIEHAGITQKEITNADASNDKKRLLELKRKYFSLKLPCVFLEQGKCMIHKVRPLDCWAFRQYISEYYCEDVLDVIGAEDYHSFKVYILGVLLSIFNKEIRPSDRILIDSIPGMIDRVLQEN